MRQFLFALRFELRKIFSTKAWWVVVALVCLVQPLMAWMEGKSLLAIGLDATPLTHPDLYEAIPPLDYLGFDSLAFGQVAIVILGGMIGSQEFKDYELRNTLLCFSRRSEVLLTKFLAMFISAFILSVCSVVLTISMTHVGLGSSGLTPIIFSAITWRFIIYGIIGWTLLILLAFGLGLLGRNSIFPALVLIPQITMLGELLAKKWNWGNFLPVAAIDRMIASPTDSLTNAPLIGGFTIFIWVVLALVVSSYFFITSDLGGKYT